MHRGKQLRKITLTAWSPCPAARRLGALLPSGAGCRHHGDSDPPRPGPGRYASGPGDGGSLLAPWRDASGSDWQPATPAGRTIARFLPASGDQGPAGALISLAAGQQFDAGQAAPRRAGLLIGSVYRLRVTNIPQAEGLEVFPTIEVIDRFMPPPARKSASPFPSR